jgi:hypothetical protein
LTVTLDNTTVTIYSTPYRLLLGQQYAQVAPAKPLATALGGAQEELELTYPSGLQVLQVEGASLTSVSQDVPSTGQDTTNLHYGQAAVTATAVTGQSANGSAPTAGK